MLLEKTIFKVDVLTVDVRVEDEIADRIQALIAGQKYSAALADRLAALLLESKNVSIHLHFVRDVGFARFISEARSRVACSHRAHIIDDEQYRRITDSLPIWFHSLETRGIRKGDDLTYRIAGGVVHTTFRAGDSKTLVDDTNVGTGASHSVLGGYFAECSEFKEPLLRSLFERR